MIDVQIPANLWKDSDEAAISAWLYTDGDMVQKGAVIAEIMVEKSTFELVAPASGALRILTAAESPVSAGDLAAQIE